jgi:3-carboxy-cis,cis-muconate cycloisomerase
VVNRACDQALSHGIPLAEALMQEEAVASRMEPDAVAALCDPRNYLGSALAFVDRVLGRHSAQG